MKESAIERAFVDYCESLGFEAVKLRVDGQNGFPDRSVFTPLGTLFFEFKTPTGKARPMQKVWRERLTALGYHVYQPTKIGEAESILDSFIRERSK